MSAADGTVELKGGMENLKVIEDVKTEGGVEQFKPEVLQELNDSKLEGYKSGEDVDYEPALEDVENKEPVVEGSEVSAAAKKKNKKKKKTTTETVTEDKNVEPKNVLAPVDANQVEEKSGEVNFS